MYTYKAKIIKVYDGDTVTAQIDLGFNMTFTEPLRILRIDAPEVRGEEKEAGKFSRDRLRELVLGKEVTIKTRKDKKGKYGRYLAEVYIEGVNVSDWLVENNLAIYKEY